MECNIYIYIYVSNNRCRLLTLPRSLIIENSVHKMNSGSDMRDRLLERNYS